MIYSTFILFSRFTNTPSTIILQPAQQNEYHKNQAIQVAFKVGSLKVKPKEYKQMSVWIF